MKIVSLIIGRGGSSLKDKNILPIKGVPLILWSAAAANRSKYINYYYVSSDDKKILETAALAGYKAIVRPDELASDTAQSSDAVRHALNIIEHEIGVVDIIVVQHANVATITEIMIDKCIDLLLENPKASAIIPAHENPEYHPMRAKEVKKDGFLESFLPNRQASANRQDLPTAVFFDHSFWVIRGREAVFDNQGQGPWPCMGRNIMPYINSGCFDVHSVEDLIKTEVWLDDNKVAIPDFNT